MIILSVPHVRDRINRFGIIKFNLRAAAHCVAAFFLPKSLAVRKFKKFS